jgi:hypothetical protein
MNLTAPESSICGGQLHPRMCSFSTLLSQPGMSNCSRDFFDESGLTGNGRRSLLLLRHRSGGSSTPRDLSFRSCICDSVDPYCSCPVGPLNLIETILTSPSVLSLLNSSSFSCLNNPYNRHHTYPTLFASGATLSRILTGRNGY